MSIAMSIQARCTKMTILVRNMGEAAGVDILGRFDGPVRLTLREKGEEEGFVVERLDPYDLRVTTVSESTGEDCGLTCAVFDRILYPLSARDKFPDGSEQAIGVATISDDGEYTPADVGEFWTEFPGVNPGVTCVAETDYPFAAFVQEIESWAEATLTRWKILGERAEVTLLQ